jgi:penicillin-binding protein 1C
VVSERTAFFVTDILSDNAARAFIFGRGGSLEFPFTVAAKTGTSQAYRDNFAIGFTKDVTVGVWVGNFDRAPMRGSSGVTGAGPIFHEVMLAAVERFGTVRDNAAPIMAPTRDVKRQTLCAMSGLAAGDACPTRVDEWVPADTQIARCSWHHASDEGLITVWPDEYRAWAQGAATARTAALTNGAMGPPGSEAPRQSRNSLHIVNPLGGATYLYDPTLRTQFQTLKLRARGAAGELVWEIDGTHFATSAPDRAVEWPLRRGEHEIVAIDTTGARAQTRITVR